MSREKSIALARAEVLRDIERHKQYYNGLIREYGATFVGVWPPGDLPSYDERRAAIEEAIALLRAAWPEEAS